MGWKDKAKDAADRTDKKLADREKQLIKDTSIDWAAMKPKLGSDEEYATLMKAVDEATQRNLTLGNLLTNLEALGQEGLALANKVRKLVV